MAVVISLVRNYRVPTREMRDAGQGSWVDGLEETHGSGPDGDRWQPDGTSLKQPLSSIVIGIQLDNLLLTSVTSLGNGWCLAENQKHQLGISSEVIAQ